MKVTLVDDAGDAHDVTSHYQLLFDTCVSSMNWSSGFLDFEEMVKITEAGMMAGFDVKDLGLPQGYPSHSLDEFQAWARDKMQPMLDPEPVPEPETDVRIESLGDATWQISDRRAPQRLGFITRSGSQWLLTVHNETGMLTEQQGGLFSTAFLRVQAMLR